MDCTSHRRYPVYRTPSIYHRGDKHFHFLTCQVFCGLDIYHVAIAPGHNNDQRMYLDTLKNEFLMRGLKVFADGGYSDVSLVTPDEENGLDWNLKQSRMRTVVENLIGVVKSWRFAAETC
eukprot:TRINITY_DN4799_c0_g2_i1.p2 TRINITY_DN4799_c0_g2~~TRINITY_DN4799_c0_g2_i1.p2  ORF type:complete len:120 (+),score=9.49 TRINITY_DN4799_c0_g2_i1:1240-1599(+)